MGEALRTLFWLAVIDLPLIYIILQVVAGRDPAGQVTLITTLTSVLLAGAAALYVAVFALLVAHPFAARPQRVLQTVSGRSPGCLTRGRLPG
ncbi:hypothetical protein [Methanoculleus sp. 10]|uniref:hypothetical protein n=1 Tax=Methanoculleus sp. 10 TaxID=430615 RepID=UPI0025F5DF93|nr:hypothetical protein [Methanoculleus sp. 10]